LLLPHLHLKAIDFDYHHYTKSVTMAFRNLRYKAVTLFIIFVFTNYLMGQILLEVEGASQSGHIGINTPPEMGTPLSVSTRFSSMAKFNSNAASSLLEFYKNGARTGAISNIGSLISLLSDNGTVSLRSGGNTFLAMNPGGNTYIGGSGFPNSSLPQSNHSLLVLQRKSNSGIGLRHEASNNEWELTIDEGVLGTDEALTLVYNGNFKGQFSPMDGTYTSSSDRRLKENIRNSGEVLELVKKLKPSRYFYKGFEQESIGFIAQDLHKVFPELVSKSENFDLLSVNYSAMSTVAIAAIQEQQSIIDAQQIEIQSLADLIQDLSNRIKKLEDKD